VLEPLLRAMQDEGNVSAFGSDRDFEISVSVGNVSATVRSTATAAARAKSAPSAYRAVPESCRETAALFALAASDDLKLNEMVPNAGEEATCGAIKKVIKRNDPEFAQLEECTHADVVFKDEEGTGADRVMSKKLRAGIEKLAVAAAKEWSGTKLRVTEAWDENNEHAGKSLHYEGRAADITTFPVDAAKLGRLGRLAVQAGFDWVWYENTAHVHVSVKA
jgi:hypothetical protein